MCLLSNSNVFYFAIYFMTKSELARLVLPNLFRIHKKQDFQFEATLMSNFFGILLLCTIPLVRDSLKKMPLWLGYFPNWVWPPTHGQNRVWFISADNELKFWLLLLVIEIRPFWIGRKKSDEGKHLIRVTFYYSSANPSLALTHDMESETVFSRKYRYVHYLSYDILISPVAML